MDLLHTPLLDDWAGPDGSRLRIRAVRPQDAPALQALIGGLSALDRRRRFHGALNNLSGQRLDDMAHVDGHRHIALVVLAERAGRETLIADVRCVTDLSDIAAEFALMVAEDWRGRGVARRALAALRRAAAGEVGQRAGGAVGAQRRVAVDQRDHARRVGLEQEAPGHDRVAADVVHRAAAGPRHDRASLRRPSARTRRRCR